MLKVANSVIDASRITGTLPVANGGTGVTTSTGTTNVVLSNSPTLTTPTIAGATLSGTVSGGGNQINNVVIGTSTPLAGAFTTVSASGLISANANLKVVNGANDFGTIQLGTSASYLVTGGATYSGYRFEVPTGTQYDFHVNSISRALINGTGLTVTGTLSATGVVTFSNYGAGTATFSSAGVISSVSDETWKIKDGVPVDPDSMLKKLEPGYWYYNNEKKEVFGTERQLGFYAQNVNAAIGPEAAPTPEEGKPWGYYDRAVLAITVMSLQKAVATIESLTARITALETA